MSSSPAVVPQRSRSRAQRRTTAGSNLAGGTGVVHQDGAKASFGNPEGVPSGPALDLHKGISTPSSREHANARNISRSWDLLRTLWSVSSLDRVATCRRWSYGGRDGLVGLERRENGTRAGITNVITCGSVHACPMCAARIRAVRALEVSAALRSVYDQGGAAVLVTTTVPHSYSDELTTLLSDLGQVWHAGRNARGVKRAIWEQENYDGYVRGLDYTHGENGHHPHHHAHLCFTSPPEVEDLEEARIAWTTAANRRLAKLGRAPLHPEHGITIKLLKLDQALEHAAGYITKTPGLSAETAGHEVAGGPTKKGRAGHRTAWEILGDITDHGEERDFAIWGEYERATKGRAQLIWSAGFRDRHVLSPEMTDEEVAADTDRLGRTLCEFPQSDWTAIQNIEGGIGRLLRAAIAHQDDDVAYRLVAGCFAAWGLDPPTRRTADAV